MLFMCSQKCFSLVLFRALVCLFFKTCNHLISKVLLAFIASGSVIKVFSLCTSGYALLCPGAFCIRSCWEAVVLLTLAYLHLPEQNLKGFIGCCQHFMYGFFLTCTHALLSVMLLSLLIFSLKCFRKVLMCANNKLWALRMTERWLCLQIRVKILKYTLLWILADNCVLSKCVGRRKAIRKKQLL